MTSYSLITDFVKESVYLYSYPIAKGLNSFLYFSQPYRLAVRNK